MIAISSSSYKTLFVLFASFYEITNTIKEGFSDISTNVVLFYIPQLFTYFELFVITRHYCLNLSMFIITYNFDKRFENIKLFEKTDDIFFSL